ncbi:MAG: Hint domain-containing protein [Sulfitobacter sp.]
MGSPNIGGDLSGSIDEGDISIGGDLDDINGLTGNTDDTFTITAQGNYGTATINSTTGEWTYTLDNSDPDVIALNLGETLTDIFTVNMLDNSGFGAGQSDTDNVTITINGIVCFAAGTQIETRDGLRSIETLNAGDICLTVCGSARQIRWIGRREVTRGELLEDPKLRPVRITKGALGGGLPLCDLLVSRQHRMLVRSQIAQRLFGVQDVLIPAVKLTSMPGIFIDNDICAVTYFHILLDRHEVILAEGTPSESLLTGPETLKSITPQAREEILALFPEVAELGYSPRPAVHIPPGKLQKQLIVRHLESNTPLLQMVNKRSFMERP